MSEFYNKNGKRRSIHNLRPILEYARKAEVRQITIARHPEPDQGCTLTVNFEDGASATIQWQSFRFCVDFCQSPRRRWRGCPVVVTPPCNAPLEALRQHVTGSGREPIVEKQLYTVITVSSNTNAFGLKSVVLLSETGEGWTVLKSAYGSEPLPAIGAKVERVNGRFALGTYECPNQLPTVSPELARKVLKETANYIKS